MTRIVENLRKFINNNPVFINNGKIKAVLDNFENLIEISNITRIAVYPVIKSDKIGIHSLLILYNKFSQRESYIIRLSCTFEGFEWIAYVENFYEASPQNIKIPIEYFASMVTYQNLIKTGI